VIVRGRRLLLALTLALLALAAWWWLRERGRNEPLDPAGVRKERADPPGNDLLAAAPKLTAGPHAARAPRPRCVLTVRVLDLPVEERGQLTLHVSARCQVAGEGESAKDVRADPSGTTVIDVEDLALRRGVHTLQVTADGPEHLPAYDALALPQDMEARKKGLDLALEVRPIRAGTLVGRVVDPDGKAIAGLLVTPDVWGGFTREEGRGYGLLGRTAADGRFRLQARPGPATVALVGSAWGPRASEPVALVAGRTADVGTIHLIAPQHWVGRVRGLAGRKDLEAIVKLHLLAPTRLSELPGVAWTRDGPALPAMSCFVDAEGRFDVPGVTPGWWKVSVDPLFGDCPSAQEVLRTSERLAHPRDGPLELDATRARLTFRTRSGGRVVAHATVLVAGEERLALSTDGGGDACLFVRPETRYDVVAFAPGFQPLQTTVTSPANGADTSLALELEAGKGGPPAGAEWTDREAPRMSLAIDSCSVNGTPARVMLFDADRRLVPTVWVESEGSVAWRTDGHLLGRGHARLVTDLAPGEYGFRVERDGFRPFERTLSFPQGNTVPVEVPIELEPE
jgi:hypothetical protein